MARFYDIKIFPAGTTSYTGTPIKEYTSFPGGQNDPGALDVTIDAFVTTFAAPMLGVTALIIKGIALSDISQASSFTGCVIYVFAGFKAGLPLNNPNQARLIITGNIFQSFANWVGTEMSLDLVITPFGGTAYPPTNLPFVWTAGTPLASALTTTLKTGFPNLKPNIQISQNLIISHTETGQYQSMPALAQYLKWFTKSAIGGTYPGVDITMTPTQINVFDQSTAGTPVQIAFQEMIGQPIWIGVNQIQFTCPMRGDLSVNDYVKMPQGLLGNGAPGAVITTAASRPAQRQASIFNGSFIINQVHHMGIFRQPDGLAWVTVFDVFSSAASTQTSPTPTESTSTGLTPYEGMTVQFEGGSTFVSPATSLPTTPVTPPVTLQTVP